MKRTLLFTVLVCLISIPKYNFAQPKSTLFDNWYLNLNVGPTIFLGDVTQNHDWYKLDPTAGNIAFGLRLTKEVNCILGFKGEAKFGQLRGNKDKYKNGSPANLSFKARFWEYNLSGVLNICNLFGGGKFDRKLNFYFYAGVGMINLQTRLSQSDKEIATWGYDRSGHFKYVTELTIPYGIGIDYKLGKKVRITLDIEHTWVASDKLDRVAGESENDTYFYPNLGITFNLSKYNRVCTNPQTFIPVVSNDSLNKKQSEKIDKLLQRADSLTKNMDDLNKKLQNQPVRVDTVIIIRVDSVYSQTIKDLMQDAGFVPVSIYFDVDKYNIKKEYDGSVATVAELLKKQPNLKLKVVGNADPQGGLNYNDLLGKRRADQVINELVSKHGIDKNRLVPESKGNRELLSKIHFEVNRRVDFIIIK